MLMEAGHLFQDEVMLIMIPSGGWYKSVGSIPYERGYNTLTAKATQTKMSESWVSVKSRQVGRYTDEEEI